VSLNIKNPEADALAHELAELTGESLTDAVTAAVRERLERVQKQKNREGMHERLAAIAHGAAQHWREPYKSMKPDDLLYDERGLPRDDR
jgi:antitoxin VapB